MKEHLEELAGSVDLPELSEDFRRCLDRRNAWDKRQKLNREARYCVWSGQSDDGRKWTPKNGDTQVRPWKGASDSRPHLVDTLAREDIAKLMLVRARGKVMVTGTESNDAEFSARCTQLLRYTHRQMKERRAETRLAASWMIERGAVAVGCWWDKQSALGYDELDMETVMTRAQIAMQFLKAGQLPEGFDEATLMNPILFPEAILDPEREAEAAEIFSSFYDDVRKDAVKKAIRDLRTLGHARFPRPYLRVNRPCIGARALGEELFVPEESDSFETARAIHELKLFTEAALRERIISHGWDEEFVEEVIETQRGNMTIDLTRAAEQRWNNATTGISRLRTDKLFQIAESYRRRADEEGVMALEYTCWHPNLVQNSTRRRKGETYAYHGLLNYDHGEMPYTLFSLERRSRLIDDSRGYGERANTWQAMTKAVWDQNVDAASISTVRPYFYPPDEPPEQWGPGAGIATSRPDRYGFFEGLEFNPLSEKVETMVRLHADRYFGRVLPDGSNVIASQALDQELADEWMACWEAVDTQTLKLLQQLSPDEIYYRVVGDEQAHPLHATREEIQGAFDVSITYNTSMLNMDYVKEVFGFVSQAMQWGSGRIDVDALTEFGFELIDPNLAGRVLKASQQAAADEIDDERNVLAAALAGIPTDVRPGQAYQMRLQWLQQELQRNQSAQQKYQQDEAVRDAIENRVQQLQHQVEQQTTNVQAGRLGGLPAGARGRK